MADVIVEFGAKIDALVKGVDQVKSRIEGVTHSFVSLAQIAGIAFSVEGIRHWIVSMGELGEQTERTMTQLGLSAQQVLEFGGMAKVVGTSLEAMTHGFERLYLNVQRSSKDAFSPGAAALKTLGINAKELTDAGNDTEKMINILHDAVSKFEPSMNLTAAVMAIGGRGIASLIPLLRLQGKEWEEMRAKIKIAREGLAEATPALAETDDKIDILSLSIQSFGARLFVAFKPAIDMAIERLTAFFQSMKKDDIESFARTIVDTLGNAVIQLIVWFKTFGATLDEIVTKLQRIAAGAALGGAMGLLGGPGAATIGAALGGSIVALWDKFMSDWTAGSEAAADKIDEDTRKLVARIKAMIDQIKGAIGTAAPGAGGGGAAAGAMNLGARDAIEAARSRIEQTLALWQGWVDRQRMIYQFDADNYDTTQMTKVRRTIEAVKMAQEAELQGLTAIRDMYPAHTKEWEDAERRRVLATQKAMTDMLKLNMELFREMRNEVKGFVDSIETSWNSSLRGLLAGTVTLKEAMRKMFADLIIYSIEWIQKKLIFEKAATLITQALMGEELATKTVVEGAKTGVTVAGATARATAETAGSAVSIGGYISDAMAAISAAVGKIFAQMTAWLTPIFGPFAPAAALGIAAGVGATAVALISKAETGTNYIARSGLASVHKGEAIVPAQFNTPFTAAGMGSAAPPITVNVTNNGPMSTHQLNQQARQIAKAVADAWRFNPSLRPQY